MPDDEREAYIASHGKREGAAFDAFLNKRVSAEIGRRDAGWFKNCIIPDVTYSSDQVKKRVSDAEFTTATTLSKHGIKARFIQDYVWIIGEDGRKRKVGLPDLENGIEIKTLDSSMNAFGAMDNYLDNSSRKKDLKCVVVDNCHSAYIEDAELIEAAEDVIRDYPTIPHLRLLLKDGRFLSIK